MEKEPGLTRVKYGNLTCAKMVVTFDTETQGDPSTGQQLECLTYANMFHSLSDPMNTTMMPIRQQRTRGHRKVST